MADWTPMTDEQRQRWKESGLFPVERWDTGPGSTPLVCPLPDRALLRALAEAIPAHIQSSGWYATGQRYEARTVHSVYGDNFRGMGRQAIASVISVGNYSGPLADYIAAACPRTVLRLLDRIEELERAHGVPVSQTDGDEDIIAPLPQRLAAALVEMAEGKPRGTGSILLQAAELLATYGVKTGEPRRTDLSKPCPFCNCAAHYICGHYRTAGVPEPKTTDGETR